MKLTYDVWAKEYEQEMYALKAYIANLKKLQKQCRVRQRSEELADRIQSLYNMYLECRHTTCLLKERAEREKVNESISQ